MYNDTNITNANNIYEIVKAANDLSGGLYFTVMLLVLVLTYFVVFKKQDFKDVFVAGSFFIFIVAILMFVAKLVDQTFIIAPLVMFLASILIYLLSE